MLGITPGLFVWNRLRFDVVSMLALLAVAMAGLVPSDQLFAGFGHPAVITVAAVLVISQGWSTAVVDAVLAARQVGCNAVLQVITLTLVVALLCVYQQRSPCALMPVAIWMSRKSGRSPRAAPGFGSLLGTITLIGTPPNIIIASYREAVRSAWWISPWWAGHHRGRYPVYRADWLAPDAEADDPAAGDKLFSVGDYVTELRVPEGSTMPVYLHNLRQPERAMAWWCCRSAGNLSTVHLQRVGEGSAAG